MTRALWLALFASMLACGSDDVAVGSSTGGTESATTSAGPTTMTTVGTTNADPTTLPTDSSTTSTSPDPDTTMGEGTTMGTTTAGPDMPLRCIQCDLFAQDCGAGERCVPWSCDGTASWTGTRCSAVAPDPAALGEPCTMQESPYSGLDDCERGAMCWNVDETTLAGECIGLCAGSIDDPACVDACAECLIPAEGILTLCLPSCDPLAPDCDVGEGCYLANEAYFCAPTSAEGLGGDPCDLVTECAAGYTCVNGSFVPGCPDGEGCCTPFCTVGVPGGCDEIPTSVCTAVFPPGAGPPCVPDTTGLCVAP